MKNITVGELLVLLAPFIFILLAWIGVQIAFLAETIYVLRRREVRPLFYTMFWIGLGADVFMLFGAPRIALPFALCRVSLFALGLARAGAHLPWKQTRPR